MKTKADLLKKMWELSACDEATKWVQASRKRTFASIWSTCDRGDWMLWLAAHTLNRKLVVRAACLVAREALVYVPAHEPRPLQAIEAAEGWCRGEVPLEEVQAANAAHAHADARAANAAAAAAYFAAANAAAAAAYFAAANAAAAAAYFAADAAAAAAAAAAHAAAHTHAANAAYDHAKSLARSAKLVRGVIGAKAFDEEP